MRILVRLAAPLVLGALPLTHALAQPADLAPCRRLLDSMTLVRPDARAAAKVERPDAQTCRFSPLRFTLTSMYSLEAASVTVRGALPRLVHTDPAHTGPAHTGPAQIQIEAAGVHNGPIGNSPFSNYIMKVQAVPFDLALDYLTDPASKTFVLQRLELQGEAMGHVELGGELTGLVVPTDPLDLSNLPEPDPAALALRSLKLQLDNRGFVEKMVTPLLVGALASSDPGAKDLEPVVEARKQAVEAVLAASPSALGVPPDTADALRRFVAEFPHPSGSLRCDVTADPPLKVPAEGPTVPALRALVAAGHPVCSYTR